MNAIKAVVLAVLSLIGILIALVGGLLLRAKLASSRNQGRLGEDAPDLLIDGIPFRDLNKNGRLDIYEDFRRPIDERVEDLLGQMTLEEKVGLMMHPMINPNKQGDLAEMPSIMSPLSTSEMVVNRHIVHFNIVFAKDPLEVAIWYNKLQAMAERTRLGIPVTLSSDPRHGSEDNPGAGMRLPGFSQWPDPLGMAATRDVDLVRRFGDIARQEYRAIGIRSALHPMADLATEPRWPRIAGTFGEDADLAASMTAAYIRGFQGEAVGPESVACMVKHFPGGGPQKDGLDPHFAYGKEQVYPGDNFDYHLPPFEAAFGAGVEQVMPYYGIPMDQTSENVGMAYNREIVTDLLRGKYGFDGVVCSDWMIAETNKSFGLFKVLDATAWGVEHLSVPERYAKAIEAGVDQFGGQHSPQHIIKLVQDGVLPESRIDESARRLLRIKFELGLFDNPYVDELQVSRRVGTPEFQATGLEAQRRSVVLLKNGDLGEGKALPVNRRLRLYIENLAPEIVADYGDVVNTPQGADLAILRLQTPYQPRGRGFLEKFFHQGDLDFKGKEKARLLKILRTTPTIVDITLDRAAVIPEIAEASAGLLASFGVADRVILDAIFGEFSPTGALPIELPSSMDAVRAQKPDVPYDSEDPLFGYKFGLRYE